jgi:AcrR family transcriptional regulator
MVSPSIDLGESRPQTAFEPLYRKLKPGRGLPPERVADDQRTRLHGAMVALVGTVGWSGIRVRPLSRAAGISTGTFYKHFANADECFASAYEAAIDRAVSRAAAEQRRQPGWQQSLRAATKALFDHFASDPQAARFALVDVFSAGPVARSRIAWGVERLEGLVARSFLGAPSSVVTPRHLIAGMTAGMTRVARTTTRLNRAGELPGLVDDLVRWMCALPSPEILSLLAPRNFGTATERRARPASTGLPARASSSLHDDRGRLLRAAVSSMEAKGPAGVTSAALRQEAGVSKRRFDACFESLEHCLLEGIEMMVREATVEARSWSEHAGAWELRLCRFVSRVCTQTASNRRKARLAVLALPSIGRGGVLRRETVLDQAAQELLRTTPQDLRPSPIRAEASIAAVWHIAQADIAAGRARGLPSVAPLLSYVLLAPIIGPETAAAAIGAELRSP